MEPGMKSISDRDRIVRSPVFHLVISDSGVDHETVILFFFSITFFNRIFFLAFQVFF